MLNKLLNRFICNGLFRSIAGSLFACAALLFFTPHPGFPNPVIGGQFTYTPKSRQSLQMIGARLGIDWRVIAQENKLDGGKLVKASQGLRINNTRIIPRVREKGLVINIPERMLYYYREGRLIITVPVALGMTTANGKYNWQTPAGKFRILAKLKNPAWYVPPSIQQEMADQGKEVITMVPPGPDNPLGKFALKTSLEGVMIHSTSQPQSIYRFVSHGCIRVMPDNMEVLFDSVELGDEGELIYEPVKVAVTDAGRVLIEVHRDIYKKYDSLRDLLTDMLEERNLGNRVNWGTVERILKEKKGIAEDATLDETPIAKKDDPPGERRSY